MLSASSCGSRQKKNILYVGAMSENLVDNWKNLIPFVSGEWVIDWTTEVPLKDSTSAAQSDINTLAVNHGLLTSQVEANSYKYIGLENGTYIAMVLSGTAYGSLGIKSYDPNGSAMYPRLCTVGGNILELRPALMSINWDTGADFAYYYTLKESNFIIVRVN